MTVLTCDGCAYQREIVLTVDDAYLCATCAAEARAEWDLHTTIHRVVAFVHDTDLGVDEDQRHRIASAIAREFGGQA